MISAPRAAPTIRHPGRRLPEGCIEILRVQLMGRPRPVPKPAARYPHTLGSTPPFSNVRPTAMLSLPRSRQKPDDGDMKGMRVVATARRPWLLLEMKSPSATDA